MQIRKSAIDRGMVEGDTDATTCRARRGERRDTRDEKGGRRQGIERPFAHLEANFSQEMANHAIINAAYREFGRIKNEIRRQSFRE